MNSVIVAPEITVKATLNNPDAAAPEPTEIREVRVTGTKEVT